MLTGFFGTAGLALPLSLTAKVVCDDGDGRFNTSQPVGVKFLPVETVVTAAGGAPALPDTFVTEGGLNGTPVTFLGCISTGTTLALARVNTAGEVIAYNDKLPFNCTASSTITERSRSQQARWLWEPKVGAFAFESKSGDPHDLDIISIIDAKVQQLGQATDGDALIIADTASATQVLRAKMRPPAATPADNVVWMHDIGGTANAAPVIDTGGDWAWFSMWQLALSNVEANTIAVRVKWTTGVELDNRVMIHQTYAGGIDQPIQPNGAFNTQGSLFFIPLMALDSQTQQFQTAVFACATNTAGCQNAARRWTSAFFAGELTTVMPYGGSANALVVAGPLSTYFLDANSGAVKNRGGTPITPSGSLVTIGLQSGSGVEQYVFNGPQGFNGAPSFPTEIVAVDKAESGELWRLEWGGGDTALGSMTLSVDESGQAWLRQGLKAVKMLPLVQYRALRGMPP